MPDAKPGRKLGELISKAIKDLELSHSEHQNIVAMAHADGLIDPQERQLLSQLQEMIANGTIKKVRD
jgi:tellurite resistance protein